MTKILTSRSEDKEYAMSVRDFKKFFKRRGSVLDPEPNHLIGECPKPPEETNEPKLLLSGGFGSDSGEEYDEKG
ncbi:hypothetical protein Tco_1153030 [Tanacetum coccineum]